MKSSSTSSSFRAMINFAPRAYLFTSTRSARPPRPFSTSVASRRNDSPPKSAPSPFSGFGGGPAPPRLPKEEQEIFEALQRSSTGAFSAPRTPPKINQSPHSEPGEAADAQANVEERVDKIQAQSASRQKDLGDSMSYYIKEQQQSDRDKISARGDGEELHPNVVRGAQPEFEGDVNPKTGEVGGPKNEPLRWGASGEWSYNGRTTDF